jgi:hypothetical protein
MRSKTMNKRVIAAVLGAAALAVPTAAAADPGHGSGHDRRTAKDGVRGKDKPKKAKKVMFVFRGSFTAPDTITALSGNAHVRKGGFVGQAVTFDFAGARVVVADSNADEKSDLADVRDGDLVLVQARVARGTEYDAPSEGTTAEPIVARKLIDKTNAPVEDREPALTSAPAE